jgi:hypothetical protein
MSRITLSIAGDGSVCGIYDDELAGLFGEGQAHITRASRVEPTADGQWTADMAGGPVLGPFALRGEALQAEVEFLKSKMFQI